MPNWCNNKLVVIAPNKKELNKFMKKAIGIGPDSGKERPLLMQALIPIPDNYDSLSEGEWQEWSMKNWGNTRELYGASCRVSVKGTQAIYRFETAWDTVPAFVRNIAHQFPDFCFYLSYHEYGFGFAGRYCFEYDECVEDVREGRDSELFIDVATEDMKEKDIERFAFNNIKRHFAFNEWTYSKERLISLIGEEYRKDIETYIVVKTLTGDLRVDENDCYYGSDIEPLVSKTIKKTKFFKKLLEEHRYEGTLRNIAI